ncbi:MAG: hypothetical protein SFU86_06395 [Pirellulaceae bacterium]|nr:hypothetical protein [Pirellulaceae bacterium]
MKTIVLRACLVAICGLAVTSFAAEPLRSSLQVGEKIADIFEPVNITGEHAGEPHCLICENGYAPVAMVFAREPSQPLMKLISKLDAATDANRKDEMGSFVVFLSEKEGLAEQLKSAAEKNSLKRIVLAIDQPSGPEGFKVAADADVTVVFYREHEVLANHAFRKGELNDESLAKVVADLPKLLAKKAKTK